MFVIVVGMGEVGRYVTEILQADRHDVVAIDQDPNVIKEIEEQLDVATLEGWGSNPKLLAKANAKEADLVVAVTDSDED